ncbi:SDR family NAD(P)-dependent oxidoreductase [Lusitaniella coriacea LEGE 07157]|uniref:SDR family NAD(P)-dependent oxidoreductase n=1 Tax=Lusitaniella coriacea LEGE 07157 TaxID=945747 RepID=A0A8J7DZL8_9CYAN|nr:oxidoreductase [Lusitaniella coriacea]MBE9117438.1 SDR family NAD(P)-dependent oxidoreductase [Lusitaniella coriacea LEGE 07157]
MSNATQKKVALVTGASAGIGKSIARQLLKDGWLVYGAARRVEKMEDIKGEGAKILFLDVTDEESMQAAIQTLLAAEGQIDALINNAGYGSYGALEDVPIDEARRQFEVNVFGLVRLTQLVLPTMRGARSGTIVNISSMGGRIWSPIGGWYHATKHAVEVLSDALRMETKPFGIHVVVVQPGAIESEWSGVAAQTLMESSKDSVYQSTIEPMARVLDRYPSASSPEVIAKAVSKAVNSRNPRRRYAAPMDAKLLIFLHWLLPDWAWDKLLGGFFK